jgi:hypothetical protein
VLAAFARIWTARWAAMTDCAAGYAASLCRGRSGLPVPVDLAGLL